MKFNNDKVVDTFLDAIDNSVSLGIRKAFKHTDEPTMGGIHRAVGYEVESCLYDWLELRTTKELMENGDEIKHEPI